MITIKNNEEFAGAGRVWMFDDSSGKTILKNLRAYTGKKKEFIPPTLQEVKDFFKERGYTEESAIKFHDYYSLGDWKDGRGTPVKNWRQKASSIWFKLENKITESKSKQTEGKFMFGE